VTEDWTDVLIALLDAGARFLVVGAHALAVQGSHFGVAWDARESQIAGRTIPFLGRETLVANKRATGRLKDLADLEALGEDV
jgi:hypothetical protein